MSFFRGNSDREEAGAGRQSGSRHCVSGERGVAGCDLCKWRRDFRFAAINVNADYAVVLHVDEANEGPSWCIAFGNFAGGEFDVQAPGGHVSCAIKGSFRKFPGSSVDALGAPVRRAAAARDLCLQFVVAMCQERGGPFNCKATAPGEPTCARTRFAPRAFYLGERAIVRAKPLARALVELGAGLGFSGLRVAIPPRAVGGGVCLSWSSNVFPCARGLRFFFF